MRILAAGDIHGDLDAVKELAEKARKYDVDLIILSGDLTLGERSVEGLLGPLVATGKKVLLIPGNHESLATAEFLANLYSVTNLHGYSIKVGELGIFGVGGANVGIFQLDEEEFYGLLKRAYNYIKDAKKKILVSHLHPAGTKMEKLCVFAGSRAIRAAIETFKPDIAICSHVHEAEGLEEQLGKTKLINVGKKGKIIEV